MALRSRIVLRCGEGLSNQAVARQCGVSTHSVSKWRERFRTDRLEGLADEPRPGAPREITDAQVEEVVTRTLESKPPQATHWSTRSMARATRLSHMAVAHSLVVIIYHLLKRRTQYTDPGGDFFDHLQPERLTRYYVHRLQHLGHKVTLEPLAA